MRCSLNFKLSLLRIIKQGDQEEKQNIVKSINARLTNYINVLRSCRNLPMSVCIFLDGEAHNEEEIPALYILRLDARWMHRPFLVNNG